MGSSWHDKGKSQSAQSNSEKNKKGFRDLLDSIKKSNMWITEGLERGEGYEYEKLAGKKILKT